MDDTLRSAVLELLERADNNAKITIAECEELLNMIPKFTTKHSLEETRAFLDYLGSPDENMGIIHVAGTNGKGSVCSYISTVLTKADYSVGLFTSPHLVSVNERFAIDNKPVSEGVFVEVFVEALRRIREYGDPEYFPTYFELLFFVAMLLYDVYPVDYLILETGLGGRLDATNAVNNPIISIITEIGYDHMEYLGESIEDIAAEKAGIIKSGAPVVFFDKRKEASDVIKKVAMEKEVRAISVEEKNIEDIEFVRDEGGNKYIAFSYKSLYDKYAGLKLATQALYQTQNASVAVAALEILREAGANITELDIREGLLSAKWSGRMEEMRPGIYIDGAHNIDGVEAFLKSVEKIECPGKKHLVFGIMADKLYKDIIRMILGSRQFDSIYVTNLDSDRSVSMSDLKIAFEECKEELGIIGLPIKYYSNVRDTITDVITMRKSGDCVFAAGSLYLVGQIKSAI